MGNKNLSLYGSIMISAAGFLTFYFVFQTYSHIQQLKVAVGERKTLLETRTKVINNVLELKKNYEDNKDKIEAISVPIPDKKRIPELISGLESMANSNGLLMTSFNITEDAQSQDSQINKLRIETKLNGTYDSFKNFLRSVEMNRRLTDVDSIKLGADQNASGLTINMTGSVYKLNINSKPKKTLNQTNTKDEE